MGFLDALLTRVIGAGRWLALPVVLLLFLQWPLREAAGRWSREANDLGQILFALYVAIALTAATRAQAHFAVDALAHRYSAQMRGRLQRLCSLIVLAPWAAFAAWSGWRGALDSFRQLERFQDTGNHGYFIIKAAVLVLALAMLAAAVLDIAGKSRASTGRHE